MLSMALHLREQDLSLREIAARLIITQGKKKGRRPSPATVLRMLRDHDEQNRLGVTPEEKADLRAQVALTFTGRLGRGCLGGRGQAGEQFAEGEGGAVLGGGEAGAQVLGGGFGGRA
jgi:hypothetical protein